jgi:hypothetical protein
MGAIILLDGCKVGTPWFHAAPRVRSAANAVAVYGWSAPLYAKRIPFLGESFSLAAVKTNGQR